MSSINPNAGVGGINPFAGMSLETMVMAVLSERHMTMENMVMDQIKQMQEKNNQLKKMGEMTAMVTERLKQFGGSPKSDTQINKFKDDKSEAGWTARRDVLAKVAGDPNKPGEYYTNAREAVKNSNWPDDVKTRVANDLDLAEAAASYGVNTGTHGDPMAFVVGDQTYGSLEAMQAKLKSQTDSLTNDTQLDQIRLQSIMAKVQNLAQLLSTMVKKFDDTHGSLIRNV